MVRNGIIPKKIYLIGLSWGYSEVNASIASTM